MNYAETLGVKAKAVESAIATAAPQVKNNALAAIADALKAQYDMDVDSKKLVIDEPIKSFGSYQVKAKLGFEVSGTVYVTVCEEK